MPPSRSCDTLPAPAAVSVAFLAVLGARGRRGLPRTSCRYRAAR